MTRAEVNRALAEMVRLREDADEAESLADERAALALYRRVFRTVEPYLNGGRACSDEAAHA